MKKTNVADITALTSLLTPRQALTIAQQSDVKGGCTTCEDIRRRPS